MAPLQVAEDAGNRFAACANAFSNLSVRKCDVDSNTILCLLRVGGPLQKKPRQLRRDTESHASDTQAGASLLVLNAKLPHDRLKDSRVIAKKESKVTATNCNKIARAYSLRCLLMKVSGECRA